MVFILFERKIFIVSVAFLNSLGSSRDKVLLLNSLLNICYSFYFPRDFLGLKYQQFPRFSIVRLPRKFTVLAYCFDCFHAEIRLSFDI